MPFYIKKALSWLQANRSSVCKISADKGYGPVYISAGYLRKQYLRETVDGAFTEVSDNELMWSLISTYDLLRSLCDRAIQNHLIDVGTMNFILQPLRDLGFPNPSKASLPAVLSCLGKIRYLVKLHKPGCKLRRVEVDTRSPFNNLTIFISSILRKVVGICETTVMDSKRVSRLEGASYFTSWLSEETLRCQCSSVQSIPKPVQLQAFAQHACSTCDVDRGGIFEHVQLSLGPSLCCLTRSIWSPVISL